MGLLEKLGLRRSEDEEFSVWLGEQVGRMTESGDEGKLELDRRIIGFVDKRGEEALVRAIDAWVDRTGATAMRSDTILLITEEGWALVLNAFRERNPGAGKGLVLLDRLMVRLGVLETRFNHPEPEFFSLTPVEAMGSVIYPLSREEMDVKKQLHAITGNRTDKPAEELVALRYWTMYAVTAYKYADAPAAGEVLLNQVLQQVERLAPEPQRPSSLTGFLKKRWNQYGRAIVGPTEGLTPVGAHAIGRQFASHFGTDSIDVREFGARQFAEAYDTLGRLVDQHRATS